tara:strand:- start:540 stop:764 length:225 start_codon:yes stop_codon:yes gene_type:complete
MKHQVNAKLPTEEWEMLKALAKGELATDCPTCGKPWDLSHLVTQDPIPPTTLASKLLKDAIRDAFSKAEFGGKH